MNDLIRQYLDQSISRRTLIGQLGVAGLSTVAAGTIADALALRSAQAAEPAPNSVRDVSGTGGELFVQQLKAAGVEYYFFSPSTGDAPIFDALVDEPGIQLIKGIQEGVVVAMADGYESGAKRQAPKPTGALIRRRPRGAALISLITASAASTSDNTALHRS